MLYRWICLCQPCWGYAARSAATVSQIYFEYRYADTKFKETTVNYVLRVLKEHFGI